jgi:hypothetical protein
VSKAGTEIVNSLYFLGCSGSQYSANVFPEIYSNRVFSPPEIS